MNSFDALRPAAETAARLTYAANRRRMPPEFSQEDATQEGCLKLLTLIRGRRASDTLTEAFVATCVRNRILDIVGRSRPVVRLDDGFDVPEPVGTKDHRRACAWIDEELPTAPPTVRGFIDARVRRDGSAAVYQQGKKYNYLWACEWLRNHHWRRV